MNRPSHRGAPATQQAWIVFAGQADMPWQCLLRPGFRHCFTALRDTTGWTVLDPLSGSLVVARLEVAAGFDLPDFYRRAGLVAIGPFGLGASRATRLPALRPMNCVGLCRAVLGSTAPKAITPHGLYRALNKQLDNRKKYLTSGTKGDYTTFINGRIASDARPAPAIPGLAFFLSLLRRESSMGSLFSAPKPVRIDPPAPPPQPVLPTAAQVTETASAETRARARRGVEGTITTSLRGVLSAAPTGLARKSLLGE